MPGPGGGGRGGGGSFGGGFGGGGFGGGPRGPRFGGFGFFPFFGGGLLSILFFPFLMILFAGILIVTTLMGAFGAIGEGGQLVYDEMRFQDFANEQYAQIFDAQGYESNILLVILTSEEYEEGYYLAWVGDDVHNKVNMMFGGEGSELGNAVAQSVNTANYKYQLPKAIDMILDTMAGHIEERGLVAAGGVPHPAAPFHNYTELPVTAQTVTEAIDDFTTRTGINIAVVIEDSEDVFETSYSQMIMGFVIAGLLITISVVLIVKGIRQRKRNGRGGGDDSYRGNDDYKYRF